MMKSRLFTFLSLGSLVLLVGVIAICVCSYWRMIVLHYGGPDWGFSVGSSHAAFGFQHVTTRGLTGVTHGEITPGWGASTRYPEDLSESWPAWATTRGELLGFRFLVGQPGGRDWKGAFIRQLIVPWWAICLILSLLPGRWLALYWKRQSKERDCAIRCRHCGYDLRASTDRCPECGTPIPPNSIVEKPAQ